MKRKYVADAVIALGPCWDHVEIRAELEAVGGSAAFEEIAGEIDAVDAVWLGCCLLPDDKDRRLFAVRCCEQIDYLLDEQARATVAVAKRYALGKATDDELSAARFAVRIAVRGARRATYQGSLSAADAVCCAALSADWYTVDGIGAVRSAGNAAAAVGFADISAARADQVEYLIKIVP